MFRRRKDFLKLRLALTDAVITVVSFGLAYVLRQNLTQLRLFYLEPGPMIGLLIASLSIWLAAGSAIGLYRFPQSRETGMVARQILRQTVWSAALLFCLAYLLQFANISRFFMVLFVAINTLLLFGWRVATPAIGRVAGRSGAPPWHYVIVGTGEEAAEVARLIQSDSPQPSEILAFIRDGLSAPESPERVPKDQIHEVAAFAKILKQQVVDEVIFAMERERSQTLEGLFVTCQEEGVKVRVVLNFFPSAASGVSLDRLHDLPLLTFSNAPDNDYLLFLKRIFDVSIALTMLAAFTPVGLIVMAAIRLSSRGPAFFVQNRSGLNGRIFRLYKFRSMYEDAPAQRSQVTGLNEMDGPVFKCANDPRITPVGRILRKFSLDEWPQLVNVIKGDMSLVGPRPPLPDEVEQYKPWQRRRLRMRPGLTCLWVLEGRNKLDFLNWMRLDLHYIDHWSLALDCKILLQSIPHVLSGKGM